MARSSKKKTDEQSASGFSLFDDIAAPAAVDDDDLPKDETGRRKIKQQYVDLLGIRVEKLKGRILNRERINKTLEGIYFICARCSKICHNLDEGLVEDDGNEMNLCSSCSQAAKGVTGARAAKAAHDAAASSKKKKSSPTSKSAKKTPAKAKSTKPTKSAKKASKSKK